MALPYLNPLKHITDISKFFEYDAKKHVTTFVGESLEIRVPKRFEVYGLLNITDTVETIGVMDLIIDDKYQASLHMLAVIEVEPSEISTIMVGSIQYQVMKLFHGDRFIANTQVVKKGNIIYALYEEFITRGNPIYTMKYEDLLTLFDQAGEMCGADLPVDHAIFEMIFSHLSRDANNLFTQYRHADMSGPMEFIALRSVAHAPDSTTARVIGSYYTEGLTASLLHHNEDRKPFEDLLRGIPVEDKSSEQ